MIKSNNLIEAYLTEEELAVVELRRRHRGKWRDKPESYWLGALVEELGELGSALNGEHEHSPDVELEQIAGICLNWLDMRNNNAS